MGNCRQADNACATREESLSVMEMQCSKYALIVINA